MAIQPTDLVSGIIPSFDGGGMMNIIFIIAGLALAGIIFLMIALALYFVMVYNKRVELWQTIQGESICIGTRWAKRQKMSSKSNVYCLVTLKQKRTLPIPKYWKNGRTACYFVDECDGWNNFKFGDWNKTKREMGLKFTDQAMELADVAIRKNAEMRLLDKSFMDKYGALIQMGIMLIFGIGMAVLFVIILKKWGELIEITGQVANALNNLKCSGMVAV